MKAYWGSGCIAPSILHIGTRWGEWLASRPGRLTPGGRATATRWIGGWMGPRAGLDVVARRKKFHHYLSQELNPGHPAHSLVSSSLILLTSLHRLPRFSVSQSHPFHCTRNLFCAGSFLVLFIRVRSSMHKINPSLMPHLHAPQPLSFRE
jgi:hypothetical protein